MAPHCRLTERIRAFIATCLAWSPNLPCDYKGLQLVGELLSLGGETLKQAVGDLHERQLWVSRVQSPSRHLRPIRASAGLRRAPRGALQAIAQFGNVIRGSLVHRRGQEHEFRDQRRATHQRYDRKRHPITGFRPRRHTPRSGQCPPGGDCVTHLVGASQSHRDRGGQHIDDVASPLTETAPPGRGHGTPRKMLAASIIGSSSTH